MIIRNIELTLLKIDKREGVGKKSGKDYLFYNASVIDDEANVFGFIIDEKITKDTEKFSNLLSEKNIRVRADIEFIPKKFDIGGSIVALEIE
jgi:hypothetical protein